MQMRLKVEMAWSCLGKLKWRMQVAEHVTGGDLESRPIFSELSEEYTRCSEFEV